MFLTFCEYDVSKTPVSWKDEALFHFLHWPAMLYLNLKLFEPGFFTHGYTSLQIYSEILPQE